MQPYHLNQQELAELRAAHRAARNVRETHRLNAVILLGTGWSPSEVAAALLINDDAVRSQFKRYKGGGIAALERMNYVGSEALLTAAQLAELDAHLQQQLHPSAASVAHWVEVRFGVRYTDSGMTALLHRLGYRFKKPKLLPGKAPAPEVQEAFVADYKSSRTTKASTTPSCSWTPPTRSITRSSVAAGSSAVTGYESPRTAADGSSLSRTATESRRRAGTSCLRAGLRQRD